MARECNAFYFRVTRVLGRRRQRSDRRGAERGVDPMNMALGPVGVWTPYFDQLPAARGAEVAQELEALGYAAVWLPEAVGRDQLVASALLVGATARLCAATGIASIYGRDPMTMHAAWLTLTEAYPDRFILGLGVSHQPMVEGMRGVEYGPPVASMRTYLDRMDASPYFAVKPSVPPRRVLAALGPKMLALSAERADGAHPYNVTPEHTKLARDIV